MQYDLLQIFLPEVVFMAQRKRVDVSQAADVRAVGRRVVLSLIEKAAFSIYRRDFGARRDML